MPTVCVVGAQWGDEGKAKVVDLLGEGADWVVRYQGGNNAGHTVVVGEETFKLHLVPSGIVRPDVRCLIAHGVVVDLEVLFAEIDGLEARGCSTANRLLVSDRAHLILPYHRVLDGLREGAADQRIGTTKKGIGPTYADKVSYRGLRVADLMVEGWFEDRLAAETKARNVLIERVYGAEPLDVDAVVAAWAGHRERLAPMVVDGVTALNEAVERDETVLFEGAQGFMLDVDLGTYPFVTGSNSSSLGVSAGAGISPRHVGRIVGVAKAYCTRVGEGPFPTEDFGPTGEAIRERGNEFGTTTGRPRRCGWFDAVAVRQAARVSGLTELAITKLDILSGMDELKVAVAYEHDGRRLDTVPAAYPVLRDATPVYREFEGFGEEVTGARELGDLPAAARSYLEALEKLVGVPIRIVGVGPGREQTLRRE